MNKEEMIGNCNIEHQQNCPEFGGTKEELIATVRTLRKNNDYDSRIKTNEIKKLQSQLDIANKKLDKLDKEIKSVIQMIRQQPSESVEDDAWVLGRLNSFLSIIGGE